MIDLSHFSSFFVANWKLNSSFEFINNFISSLNIDKSTKMCVAICAPYIYLNYLEGKRKDFYLGAQDCSSFEEGAYTGEVSAKMLNDVGISFCIVGHSERRHYFNESSEIVKQKAIRLIENNIVPIICVGETLDEKNNNKTQNVLKNQLEESIPEISNQFNTIIAYEPIWAIGTGLTPRLEEIENAHKYIKNLSKKLFNFKIIYGGSVNSKNSKLISKIDIVNGALIGGASLKINEFNQIIS